jgi:hypothetical protein
MIQDQLAHNLAKGPFIAALLDSFLLYTQGRPNQLNVSVAKDFFYMNCNPPINETLCSIEKDHYNLTSALAANASEQAISLAVSLSSFGQAYYNEKTPFLGAKFGEYARGENNSAFSLASRSILANLSFYNAFIDATIVDYAQRAPTPTYVWTLAYDSVISSNNSRSFK